MFPKRDNFSSRECKGYVFVTNMKSARVDQVPKTEDILAPFILLQKER